MRTCEESNLPYALIYWGKYTLLALLLTGLILSLLPRQAAAADSKEAAYQQWVLCFIPHDISSAHWKDTETLYRTAHGVQHSYIGHAEGWFRSPAQLSPAQIRFDAPNHISIQKGEDCWSCMRKTHAVTTSHQTIKSWLQDFFRPDEWGNIHYGSKQFITLREFTDQYNGVQCPVIEFSYNALSDNYGPAHFDVYLDPKTRLIRAKTFDMYDADGKTLVEHGVREYDYNQPLPDSLFVHNMPDDTN